MGLGAAACKRGGFTYFSRDGRVESRGEGLFQARFPMDSRITWGIAGRPSLLLTRLLEGLADGYMKVPGLQPRLMSMATRLRKRLRIAAQFVTTPPVAACVFDYAVSGARVDVHCAFTGYSGAVSKLHVVNELGADHFRAAIGGGRTVAPPSGWQPLPVAMPTPALYDPARRTRFSIDRLSASPPLPVSVFWGREKLDDYCWAGFELEIDLTRGAPQTFTLSYSVVVE